MTTKHTPGPLFVDNSGKYSVRIVDAKGEAVCCEPRSAYSSKQETVDDVMTGRYMGKDKQAAIEANERQLADMFLRAAGPELLEAVNLVLQSFAYAPGEGPEWFEACRLVKAKAEGESHA